MYRLLTTYAKGREALARPLREWHARDRLIILDRFFPNPIGAWRTAEYHAYLDAFAQSEVHTDGGLVTFGGLYPSLWHALGAYRRSHPHYTSRVRPHTSLARVKACGFYTLFLNEAASFLPFIERHRAGFVFTLYPGGGFHLDQASTDAKLRRVFNSPNFRAVVVTQHVTQDYLLSKQLVPPSAIRFVWGGVMPPTELAESPQSAGAGLDKPAIEIGFIAHKYFPRGAEQKGYDLFVLIARILLKRYRNVVFHVIGGFSARDIELVGAQDHFTFHGPLPASELPGMLRGLDLIISPNRPFQLAPGVFDGFPTGGCVQAGLAGVPVFCTDELRENREFVDGKDIVLIPPDAAAAAEIILPYLADRDKLRVLGRATQQTFRWVYSTERQIAPRIAVLRELMNGSLA
jgi:glycosyltransferase involved in cell wall biosynthesis